MIIDFGDGECDNLAVVTKDGESEEIELISRLPVMGDRPFRFVYFGGGTPSFLSGRQLTSLVDRLRANIAQLSQTLSGERAEREDVETRLAALQRQLKRLQRKEYIVQEGSFNQIDEMVDTLDKGQNVILHFGRHDSSLDHMLQLPHVTRLVIKHQCL